MAIYSLHTSMVQRSKGAKHKATFLAAYDRGVKMYDERTKTYSEDNNHKNEVAHSQILIPKDSPEWVQKIASSQSVDGDIASELLWNKVELSEKRCDAQVARRLMIALPRELTIEKNKELLNKYLQENFCDLGMIADYSIHWKDKNGIKNPHAHVLLTTRHLTEDGFGLKNRSWNDRALGNSWREQWAVDANEFLSKYGHEVRIDHRTLEAQGSKLLPTIKLGNDATRAAEKGIMTPRYMRNEEIKRQNFEMIKKNPELLMSKMAHQESSFSFEDIANECIKQVPVTEILENNSPISAKRSRSIGQQILKEVLRTEVVFSERDLARQLNMTNVDAKDFVQVLSSIKGSKELIYLGVGSDGRDRYTTKSCFKAETQMIDKVEKLATSMKYFVESDKVDNAIERFESDKGFKLSYAQKQAISHLTSGADISCLVGQAGTGKTTVLTPAVSAWKEQGYKTIGVALANVAANNLKECNFDKTMSVFSLIEQIEKYDRELLDDKTVLVIDEFSMVGSEDAAKLVALCNKYFSKMVMVGDYGQLYGVKGGAPMKAIKELIGCALLDDIIRQQEKWQRRASQNFAIGNIEEGLQAYYDKGNIHFVENDISTKEALINSWIKDDTTLSKKIIMAHENKDVSDLNARARKALVEKGVLKDSSQLNMHVTRGFIKKKIYSKHISLAVNERIAFERGGYIKSLQMKIANNQMATITNIKNGINGGIKSLSLRLDGEDKGIVLKAKDIREQNLELVHSYAATVHKLQGCTLDKAWGYASTMWDRSLLYVAMTRHKLDVQLYASSEKFNDLKDLVRQCSRKAVKDSVLDFPLKFSMNRGMKSEDLIGIKYAFADKIITKSQAVRDFVELRLNPEKYHARKQLEETLKINKEEAIYRQREAQQKSDNTIVVGKYLDANQECGKLWSCVHEHAKENAEFWDIENDRPDLLKMRDLTIYRDAKLATQHASDLANIIVKNVDRYKEILRDNGIDLEILEFKQQESKLFDAISDYKQGKNKLESAKIITEILESNTKHYPSYLEAEISTKQLKDDFKEFQRQKYINSLKSKDLEKFRLIEQYDYKARQAYAAKKEFKDLKHKLIIDNAINNLSISEKSPIKTQINAKAKIGDSFGQEFGFKIDNVRKGNNNIGLETTNSKNLKFTTTHSSNAPTIAKITHDKVVKAHKIYLSKQAECEELAYTIQKNATDSVGIKFFEFNNKERITELQNKYEIEADKQAINHKLLKGIEKQIKFLTYRQQQIGFDSTNYKIKHDLIKHDIDDAIKNNISGATLVKDYLKLVSNSKEYWEFHSSGILEQNANRDLKNLAIDKNKERNKLAHELYVNKEQYKEILRIANIKDDYLAKHASKHQNGHIIDNEKIFDSSLAENYLYNRDKHISYLNKDYSLDGLKDWSIGFRDLIHEGQELGHHSQEIKDIVEKDIAWLSKLEAFGETPKNLDYDKERIKVPREIVKQTIGIINDSPADLYLKGRGIAIEPSEDVREGYVYNSELKQEVPAIIAVARDHNERTTATQTIFLDKGMDGKYQKRSDIEVVKRTNGIIHGSSCCVHKGTSNEKEIVLCEGVETALSVAQANPQRTVYALFGSSNFANFELRDEDRGKDIIICQDNDGDKTNSKEVIHKAAETLSLKGYNLYTAEPGLIDGKKTDYNDVLIHKGEQQIQQDLQQRTLVAKAITKENLISDIKDTANLAPEFEPLLKTFEIEDSFNTELRETIKTDNMRQQTIVDYFGMKNLNDLLLQDKNKQEVRPSDIAKSIDRTKQEMDVFNSYVEKNADKGIDRNDLATIMIQAERIAAVVTHPDNKALDIQQAEKLINKHDQYLQEYKNEGLSLQDLIQEKQKIYFKERNNRNINTQIEEQEILKKAEAVHYCISNQVTKEESTQLLSMRYAEGMVNNNDIANAMHIARVAGDTLQAPYEPKENQHLSDSVEQIKHSYYHPKIEIQQEQTFEIELENEIDI